MTASLSLPLLMDTTDCPLSLPASAEEPLTLLNINQLSSVYILDI